MPAVSDSSPGRPSEHGHPDPALVEVALVATESAAGIEEVRVVAGAAFLVRTVVPGEEHQRVPSQPELAQPVDDLADLRVQQGDLGRVPFGAVGPRLVLVRFPAGNRVRRVRQRRVEEEQERFVLVPFDEVQGPPDEQLGRVRDVRTVVLRVVHPIAVLEQVRRVIVVRVRVGDVPEELVEAALVRMARLSGLFRAEAPLPEARRTVAGGTQRLRERHVLGRQRRLRQVTGRVLSHRAVAAVQAGEQHAPGRRADRPARVAVGEPHALVGQLVQSGGPDPLLAVRAELAEPEIVGLDEHDVRRALPLTR